MSKKRYVKPELEMVRFNNNDANMLNNPTYLVSLNFNAAKLKYKGSVGDLHY